METFYSYRKLFRQSNFEEPPSGEIELAHSPSSVPKAKIPKVQSLDLPQVHQKPFSAQQTQLPKSASVDVPISYDQAISQASPKFLKLDTEKEKASPENNKGDLNTAAIPFVKPMKDSRSKGLTITTKTKLAKRDPKPKKEAKVEKPQKEPKVKIGKPKKLAMAIKEKPEEEFPSKESENETMHEKANLEHPKKEPKVKKEKHKKEPKSKNSMKEKIRKEKAVMNDSNKKIENIDDTKDKALTDIPSDDSNTSPEVITTENKTEPNIETNNADENKVINDTAKNENKKFLISWPKIFSGENSSKALTTNAVESLQKQINVQKMNPNPKSSLKKSTQFLPEVHYQNSASSSSSGYGTLPVSPVPTQPPVTTAKGILPKNPHREMLVTRLDHGVEAASKMPKQASRTCLSFF